VQNLLRNALEAVAEMPEGGRVVQIQMQRDGGRQVLVRVIDSGPGMAAEETERIFDVFTTTKATGMGVGLALSHAVVVAHGGRLWAVPGSRGMVCFTLPAAQEEHG